MVEVWVLIVAVLGAAFVAYGVGRSDSVLDIAVAAVVEQEQWRLIRKLKADALAYGAVKGLWATDMPHIIKHHARKDCFRRIGFPEQKL